jgi:hypothetical protein
MRKFVMPIPDDVADPETLVGEPVHLLRDSGVEVWVASRVEVDSERGLLTVWCEDA